MKHLKLFEEFMNEAAQYTTLSDDRIKAGDIHKWLVSKSYDVGKRFPASRAKTKEDKIAIVMNPEFQAAYLQYHQQYFDSLLTQWDGVCNSNLPSRGIDDKTTKTEKENMFDALESWITRENGILETIKEIGFEAFVANEAMGAFYKKPLNLKRKY